MNKSQWNSQMPALLNTLAPGTYALRTIFASAGIQRLPQAHEGVFMRRDVAQGLYPKITFYGKDINNADLYLVR